MNTLLLYYKQYYLSPFDGEIFQAIVITFLYLLSVLKVVTLVSFNLQNLLTTIKINGNQQLAFILRLFRAYSCHCFQEEEEGE